MCDYKTIIEFLLSDVIEFHEDIGKYSVMRPGVHDSTLLESAIHAPFQSYGGVELHPTIFDKAARLCYGIAKNHGFNDGNKRTGIHAMTVFLEINGLHPAYGREEMKESYWL